MFIIESKLTNEFKTLYENHKLLIASANIFYQHIRLINGRHKIMDRDAYKEYYSNILTDIKLETSPIDAFIPGDANEADLFIVNRSVKEYEKIQKRVTLDDIYETIPMTHDICMKLKENPNLLTTVIDDVFIYYCVYKYLEQIELVRLNEYSNMTPVIEYVVKHIPKKYLENYLSTSKRLSEEKCNKYCPDAFFIQDFDYTTKFYSEAHGDIPAFDVRNLIERLVSNIVVKSDIYIITGIYLTLAFSMVDISNSKVENSPHVEYVRDVLSQI